MDRAMRQCLRRRRENEDAAALEERAAELAEERGGPVTRRRHRQDVSIAAAEEERARKRNRRIQLQNLMPAKERIAVQKQDRARKQTPAVREQDRTRKQMPAVREQTRARKQTPAVREQDRARKKAEKAANAAKTYSHQQMEEMKQFSRQDHEIAAVPQCMEGSPSCSGYPFFTPSADTKNEIIKRCHQQFQEVINNGNYRNDYGWHMACTVCDEYTTRSESNLYAPHNLPPAFFTTLSHDPGLHDAGPAGEVPAALRAYYNVSSAFPGYKMDQLYLSWRGVRIPVVTQPAAASSTSPVDVLSQPSAASSSIEHASDGMVSSAGASSSMAAATPSLQPPVAMVHGSMLRICSTCYNSLTTASKLMIAQKNAREKKAAKCKSSSPSLTAVPGVVAALPEPPLSALAARAVKPPKYAIASRCRL